MPGEEIKQAFIDLMAPVVLTKGGRVSSYAREAIVRHMVKQPTGPLPAIYAVWEKAERILKLYEEIKDE